VTRRRQDGQNRFFARPQNDGLGKLSSRDLHGGGRTLCGVGRGMRHYRIRNLVFLEETLQTCGYAHGRTPFALCIYKIIAQRKTKGNMYAAAGTTFLFILVVSSQDAKVDIGG
jgi:hypothetical protein